MDRLTAPQRFIRVELTCFYCGHGSGEVRVAVGERPSYRDVRIALEATPDAPAIEWDAHGAPRCPRCRGKLFLQESDRRATRGV